MASTFGVTGSTSLPAGSAGIANGNIVDLGVVNSNPVAVITSSAVLTAGNLFFQGSLDGVNWYSLAVAISAAADFTGAFSLAYKGGAPARFVRVIITTAITGGTVSAMVAGGV